MQSRVMFPRPTGWRNRVADRIDNITSASSRPPPLFPRPHLFCSSKTLTWSYLASPVVHLSRFWLRRPPLGPRLLSARLFDFNFFPCSIGSVAAPATSLFRFQLVAAATLPRLLFSVRTNSAKLRSSLGRIGYPLAPPCLATMGLDWRIQLRLSWSLSQPDIIGVPMKVWVHYLSHV